MILHHIEGDLNFLDGLNGVAKVHAMCVSEMRLTHQSEVDFFRSKLKVPSRGGGMISNGGINNNSSSTSKGKSKKGKKNTTLVVSSDHDYLFDHPNGYIAANRQGE